MKTPRERRLEKALKEIAAKLNLLQLPPAPVEILLGIVQKAFEKQSKKAKPLSKGLRAAYKKSHPRA
jgi:hypothetical protein